MPAPDFIRTATLGARPPEVDPPAARPGPLIPKGPRGSVLPSRDYIRDGYRRRTHRLNRLA
jgi:hypothetical protein